MLRLISNSGQDKDLLSPVTVKTPTRQPTEMTQLPDEDLGSLGNYMMARQALVILQNKACWLAFSLQEAWLGAGNPRYLLLEDEAEPILGSSTFVVFSWHKSIAL